MKKCVCTIQSRSSSSFFYWQLQKQSLFKDLCDILLTSFLRKNTSLTNKAKATYIPTNNSINGMKNPQINDGGWSQQACLYRYNDSKKISARGCKFFLINNLLLLSIQIKKFSLYSLYYAEAISSSGEAHLHGLVTGQHSFEETSQRWRAVVANVDLTRGESNSRPYESVTKSLATTRTSRLRSPSRKIKIMQCSNFERHLTVFVFIFRFSYIFNLLLRESDQSAVTSSPRSCRLSAYLTKMS